MACKSEAEETPELFSTPKGTIATSEVDRIVRFLTLEDPTRSSPIEN